MKDPEEIVTVGKLRVALATAREEAAHHMNEHMRLMGWLRAVSPELFQRALKELAFHQSTEGWQAK